jgi:hypothetical protein
MHPDTFEKSKTIGHGFGFHAQCPQGAGGVWQNSANSANQAGLGLFPNEFALTMLPG